MTRLPSAACALLVFALVPGLAHAADPIGPENCKTCHPSAWRAWRESQHARATGSLTPKQLKDGRCLSCHSPDSGRGLAAVTCEACHGGGQFYSPRYVMKDAELSRAVGLVDPTEKTCRKCHDANAPSLRPFVFAEKLKQIDHWTAERAARKAREAAAARSAPPAQPKRAR